MSIESVRSSHPLSSPSPAFNLSQHQGLLQWISSLYEVPKLLKLSCPIFCPTIGGRGGLVFWMAIECVAQLPVLKSPHERLWHVGPTTFWVRLCFGRSQWRKLPSGGKPPLLSVSQEEARQGSERVQAFSFPWNQPWEKEKDLLQRGWLHPSLTCINLTFRFPSLQINCFSCPLPLVLTEKAS